MNPIEQFGYKAQTTFWTDFSIAEPFGCNAIRDTYKRAMEYWRDNHIYLTELVMVLNHKIWQWYGKNDAYAETYNELWECCNAYAQENLKGEKLEYFYEATD